jgi:hypothetical protein
MGLAASASLAILDPRHGEEPSSAWVAATLGVSLEDADWLLICYRFADPDAWRPIYVCEPL